MVVFSELYLNLVYDFISVNNLFLINVSFIKNNFVTDSIKFINGDKMKQPSGNFCFMKYIDETVTVILRYEF